MLGNQHSGVSRRGQWRDQIEVYSPNGGTDPSLCTYRFRMWRPEGGCSGDAWDSDYGLRWHIDGYPILDASSNDGTGRLVPVQADTALVLNWQFPLTEMMRLRPGTYTVSITAALADETSEIATFTVVVS